MKRTNRISSIVWAIGVIGIAVTLFLAWTGMHTRHPAQQVKEPTSSTVATQTATPATPAAPATAAPIANIPEEGLTGLVPVPLAPILVPAENGSWIKDKDYLLVPHEAREFGGIPFLMDGLLQLQSHYSKEYRQRTYRTAISVPLPIMNTVGSVHLLGGTRYGEQPQVCAQMIWHYNDRSTARTPIANLTHFRDWVRNPYEQPAHLPYAFSKVVWTATPQPNRVLRLYRVSLANPQPQKPVQSIEFVSEMQDPTLFLVGMTLDSLRPGERPDDTADLEPTDSIPARTIQIAVTDSGGLPLPNSRLRIEYIIQDDAKTSRSASSLTTDVNGIANVGYPPQDLNTLDIGASHENYGGRKMLWNLKSGDVVPASYTLKLPAEITIGATVVDVDNNPIPGATISLHRFWSGDDGDPNKKGEQADFRTQNQTTGPDGHWRATGLPPELMNNIDIEVSHSDYLGTNYTMRDDAALEKQLRAETLKIPLFRGTGARGLVTDENDNPISGATVWVGRRYSRERKETKTDSQGRFSFQHVTEGDVSFSVIAKDHEPATQTVTVESGMPDILFKLNPGHVIRGIVQDDSGSPISGVQVSLEDPFGNETYEFSATTDDDGKFSWESAPGKPVKFYFGKQGYEQKREVSLKPDEDNVITLHAPRRLEGLVLDSSTGQPIPQFSIRTGHRSGSDDRVYGMIRDQDFNSPDGRFSTQLDEADDDAVMVWNDDHATKVESFPPAENGVVQVTVRLDPSEALKGTVTTAAGMPVPGASVAVVGDQPGSGVQFQGNRFRSYDSRTKVATTDEQGAFTLSSPPKQGNVVAVSEAGYGSAPIDQVRASHVVMLQAFGRIEGTLKIAGAPSAGQSLLYNPPVSGLMADFNTYKSTTDEQGHFTMERIPPGEGFIVRLVQTSGNSWMHSHKTPVTVQPGQTTEVTLGDSGAVLRGSVRFQTPPTNSTKLVISGSVSTTGPRPPTLNSAAEIQAYLKSPEWQAQIKQMKSYSFVVNADGTFQVDSVAPGAYTINVNARQGGENSFMNPPVGQGSIQFTVPEAADPMNPIFVGEIMLMASPSQQTAIPKFR